MTSPDGHSNDKRREFRNEAVSTVIQDMGSSRLRILGDLMESRKRAEAHEQEFLRTIHSENAAFSQIVSIFESHLKESQSSADSRLKSCLARMTTIESEVIPKVRAEVTAELGPSIAELRTQLEGLVSDFRASTREAQSQQDLVNQRLETLAQDAVSTASEYRSMLESKCSRLDSEMRSIQQQSVSSQSGLSSRMQELDSRLSAWEQHMSHEISSRISSSLEGLRGSMMSEIHVLVSAQQAQLESLLAASLLTLKARLQSQMDTVKQSEDRISVQLVEKLQAQGEQFTEQLDTVRRELMGSISSVSDRVTGCVPVADFEKLPPLVSQEIDSKLTPLAGQISALSMSVSNRLSEQDTLLQSVASTGFYHDWPIDSSKITPAVTSAGKYVSSELFSIGPYPNLQLRFFPVSAPGTDQPTVWLISSGPSSVALPVHVDLGIDDAKKCMCKMKKIPELFGHWVWEAVIPTTSNSIVVSVEISMRQWMGTDVSPPQAAPLSPSSSSAFTFLPVTNPFEPAAIGSTTPRRESWARFGLEEEPPATNPFRTI